MRSLVAVVSIMFVVLGCVITTRHTIDAHIVVDIRHIEEQAEDVLDYIEGKTDGPPAAGAPAKGKSSLLERGLEFVTPIRTAYAAELKATSPRLTELAKSMKERFPKLEALEAKGCLGEDNRGYVDLRPCEGLEGEAKNDAQKLVAAENADRKAFYKEIAEQNTDQNVTLTVVERIYAQKRLERAKPGDIFQLPPTGEDFDKFKTSALGKKLGAECQPDAWVTIK
ncbi:MAG: YdbL family protein [Candidatus Hydrogenedentes bacterium]|nr:YdbL family protein [Candidatus Hydrogenedentota bacterium]